jgi:hypothetical protein
MRYIKWDTIAASLPPEIRFTQDQLLKIGRQTETPLPYQRESDRNSPAMWEVDQLKAWFRGRCKKSPKLADEFERNLIAQIARASAPAKAAKK